MKKLILVNAFSLNMLDITQQIKERGSPTFDVFIQVNSLEEVKLEIAEKGFVSYVGHESTAKILSAELGVEVAFNRETVSLSNGDRVVVAQYIGPRLPEGATSLPEGARIQYFYIIV